MDSIDRIITVFPDEMARIGSKKYKIIVMTGLYHFILLELDNINYFDPEGTNIITNEAYTRYNNRLIMIIQINNLYFKNKLYFRRNIDDEYNLVVFKLDKSDIIKNNFDDTVNTIKKYNKDYIFHISKNNTLLNSGFSDITERKKKLISDLEEKNNKLFEKEEVLKYKNPDHPILEETCAICIDQFSECPDDIVTLSCGHLFCGNCLSSLKKKECPICKMEFIGYSQNMFIKGMLKKSPYSVAKIEYNIVKGEIGIITNELEKINKDYNSLLDKKEDIIKRKQEIELELKNIDNFLLEISDSDSDSDSDSVSS
jgi:hypothetical protein